MRDHAPLLENAFRLEPTEESYLVDRIDGQIPDYVRGSYYLNGPARFSRGDVRYRHWLDGDGMVRALRFDDAGVRFSCRYVRGTKLLAEQECGRPVFRTFGTSFPGDRLKRGIATESPLNVSVYPLGQRLLAFGEQSLPVELDPDTLETVGPYSFGDQINEISPFAAHPKFDGATGEVFNFGVSFSAAEPCLHLYRFGGQRDGGYRKRFRLPYPCAIHDFALTPRHAVFFLSPHLLNFEALRKQGGTTLDALSWEPQRGSRLLLIDRHSGTEAACVPLGHGYCLHLINAFEERGRLVADLLEFERPVYDQYLVPDGLFVNVSEGRPVRLVVDLTWGRLLECRELNYRQAPDFPAVAAEDAGRPYRDFWTLGMSAAGRPGRKFFDQLARGDSDKGAVEDVYQAPPRHYLGGEPVFVGDARRREGVVICQLFDAESVSGAFALFGAFDVARGPIAMIHLRAPSPLGFHAAFRPEAVDLDPCPLVRQG